MLKDLQLVKPTLSHKARHLDMLREWEAYGGHIAPWAMTLHDLSYEDWLTFLKRGESKLTCKAGMVPGHLYLLMEGEELIGAIDIRMELNDYLQKFGGHIGYGIRPSRQGMGYGKKQLALALKLCKQEHGLDRLLITCNKDNRASAAVIIANGGVHDGDVVDGDGKLVSRYWVTLP